MARLFYFAVRGVCETTEDAGWGESAEVGLERAYMAGLSDKPELSSFALAVSDRLKLFKSFPRNQT